MRDERRRITVAIADDHELVGEALAAAIDGDPVFEVVGIARDADQAIRLASTHRPDVALVDVRMPAGGGQRAARGIRLVSPDTRIVALSSLDDRTAMRAMAGAGACGYIVKGSSWQHIRDAIRRTARGEDVWPPDAGDDQTRVRRSV